MIYFLKAAQYIVTRPTPNDTAVAVKVGVAVWPSFPGHRQAAIGLPITLSFTSLQQTQNNQKKSKTIKLNKKLLTQRNVQYCLPTPTVCSGQLSLLPSAGQEMSSSSRATGWRPSALIGAVVCLCAAPRVQLFAIAGNGWPHNAPRYHQLMPVSCHFQDCKALLFESTHVNSSIPTTQTFTFIS